MRLGALWAQRRHGTDVGSREAASISDFDSSFFIANRAGRPCRLVKLACLNPARQSSSPSMRVAYSAETSHVYLKSHKANCLILPSIESPVYLKLTAANSVRRFISLHHAHCGIPVTWRFHNAVFNGATLIGVAVVGNPVAPALMGRGILEVNRLCIPATCRPRSGGMLPPCSTDGARVRRSAAAGARSSSTPVPTSRVPRSRRVDTRGKRSRTRLAQRPPAALEPEQLDRQGPLEPNVYLQHFPRPLR